MLYELIPIRGREALVDLPGKPVIIIYEPFNCFLNKRRCVSTLLRSHSRQLFFHVGLETHFHAAIVTAPLKGDTISPAAATPSLPSPLPPDPL